MEKAREFLSTQDNDGKDYLDSHVVEEKSKSSEKKKKKRRIPKKWIISILILILAAWGSIWFFGRDRHQEQKTNLETSQNQSLKEDESIIIETNSDKTRILDIGVYNFKMNAGEETGWLEMPNKSVRYRIGSPDDRWIIIFDDGKVVKGWDNEPIPSRNLARFKIKSLKNQCVKITIINN